MAPRRAGPGAQASGGGSGDAAAGAGAGAGAASGQLQLTDVSDCCKWCEASPVVLRCSRCLLVKYCDDDCGTRTEGSTSHTASPRKSRCGARCSARR